MKRMDQVIGCLTICASLLLCACALPVDAAGYIGADTSTPAPAAVATLVTPAPTPEPKMLAYDMQETLFRRDGLSATVTNITYVEGQSVSAAVVIRNQSNQLLTFGARVPGAFNGWATVFQTAGYAPEETFTVSPGTEETLELRATLDKGAAPYQQLDEIATLNLAFSGMFGEKNFAPAANTIVNPGCAAGYTQRYGDAEKLVYQSARARYYYHALDPLTATLYLSAESRIGACELTAVACVNGYALGAAGTNGGFTESGTQMMLAIPLLDTLRAYAQNSVETLTLSVFYTQKGKLLGADTFVVPAGDEAAASWQPPSETVAAPALPVEAPAYPGTGRTFYRGEGMYFYYAGLENEASDYYGTVTRFRLVCANDTDDAIYPCAERILLAGAVMEGGFVGYVPPHSVTNLDFYINAHVAAGPEIGVTLALFDCASKLRRVVAEEITFLS